MISLSNVIVFVLMIIINFLLVLSLANMKMNILEKSPFSISHVFLYFSVFFHFIFLHYFSSIYIFLMNFCFSFFLSSGVLILSQTLILFFVSSLSQSVGISFCDSFSFSFALHHCQSLHDISRFDMMYCII